MADRTRGTLCNFRSRAIVFGLAIVLAVGLTTSVGAAGKTPEPGGPPRPVVIGGVRFEAADGGRSGWIQAVDVKDGRLLWTVRAFPAGSLGDQLVDNPEAKVEKKTVRVLELFAVEGKLGVVGVPGRAAVVDLATHKVSPVRDARSSASECPVHHEPTRPGLDTIRYGLATPPGFPTSDEFPFARRLISAGCCVMPEREQISVHCASCLQAQQVAMAKKSSRAVD